MRTGYLNMEVCQNNSTTDENFNRIGNNTGNTVFCNAIQKIFECDNIFPNELEKASQCEQFITAAFIWIRENEDKSSFKRTMQVLKNKPIVPISIGLQSSSFTPDFKIHPNTVKLFEEMQEKCVLAVRGNYTAEILNKHGIKNIQVVGCPSMFTELNPNKRIDKKPTVHLGNRISCNYKTLTKELTSRDYEILSYLNSYSTIFMEQTKNYIPAEYYGIIPKEVLWLITKKKRIFFIFDDWLKLMKSFDFSVGARFHGNMVALLANVPSLFLTFDSRTTEMTDYFKLPTLDIKKFDVSRPISYYYDLADYSEFNKNYPKIYNEFVEFAEKNNLRLRLSQS